MSERNSTNVGILIATGLFLLIGGVIGVYAFIRDLRSKREWAESNQAAERERQAREEAEARRLAELDQRNREAVSKIASDFAAINAALPDTDKLPAKKPCPDTVTGTVGSLSLELLRGLAAKGAKSDEGATTKGKDESIGPVLFDDFLAREYVALYERYVQERSLQYTEHFKVRAEELARLPFLAVVQMIRYRESKAERRRPSEKPTLLPGRAVGWILFFEQASHQLTCWTSFAADGSESLKFQYQMREGRRLSDTPTVLNYDENLAKALKSDLAGNVATQARLAIKETAPRVSLYKGP